MAKVFVGVPSYLNRIEHVGVAFGLMNITKGVHEVAFSSSSSSANCFGFNMLWCQALEARGQGFTHFLMHHTDIVPELYFLDKMMALMEKNGADVLSVIMAIKDEKGVTSTALDGQFSDLDPKWRVRRLTFQELYAPGSEYEPTFTRPNLLVNDGLMLVDLRKPWVEKIWFHNEDRIIEHEGGRLPVFAPEDWNFSRDAHALGASVWATREVKAEHHGTQAYPNTHAWGAWATDQLPPKPDPVVQAALKAAMPIDGYMAQGELQWLAEKAKDAEVIIEVGSWKGRSTKAMAAATKGVIYAVDHWRGSGGGDATGEEAKGKDIKALFKENLAAEIAAGKVVIVDCDHADAVPILRNLLGDTEADLVFIDGDHEYLNVRRDIEGFIPLVRTKGTISGHDLSSAHPGVEKALRECLPKARAVAGSIWAYETQGAWGLVQEQV